MHNTENFQQPKIVSKSETQGGGLQKQSINLKRVQQKGEGRRETSPLEGGGDFIRELTVPGALREGESKGETEGVQKTPLIFERSRKEMCTFKGTNLLSDLDGFRGSPQGGKT